MTNAIPQTLEEAYTYAMAAFTAPVRFVEWKLLKVERLATPEAGVVGDASYPTGDDWQPMTLVDDTQKHEAYAEIEGSRWIYAFARPAGSSDPPTLVEELLLEPYDAPEGLHHTIYATPLGSPRFDGDGPTVPKISSRPKPEKIGSTLRFVRRWRGRPMVHYFFATRVQLSPGQIEKLRKKVAYWVPPTHFEAHDAKTKETIFGEADPNVIGPEGQGAQRLVVPVLDPITVAAHLHAMFAAAADALIEYVGYEGQDETEKRAALARQHKLLLANVVGLVLTNTPDRKGDLLRETAVDDWIAALNDQIQSRANQRDRWHTYLWNWLGAEPIAFLTKAHFDGTGDDRAMKLFVPMLMFISRGNETAAGRAGLKAIIKDSDRHWGWVHEHVIPSGSGDYVSKDDATKGAFKVSRKLTFAVIEAAAPLLASVALDKGTPAAFARLEGLRKLYGIDRFTLDGKPLPEDPDEAAQAFQDSTTKELDTSELAGAQAAWKGGLSNIKAAIQVLNLAFYIADFLKKPSLKTGLGTAGAAMSTAKALLGFVKIAKPTGPMSELAMEAALEQAKKAGARLAMTKEVLGYVAGVIDLYLGIQGIMTADKEGENTVELGYVMVSTGGMLSSFGPLILGLAEGGPVVILGLLVATIGYVLVYGFKDSPMTRFLKHSPWGELHHEEESFDDVPGMHGMTMKPNDFVGQLEVLLHLLCLFRLDSIETPTDDDAPNLWAGELTLGWVPPRAKLTIGWTEAWGPDGGGNAVRSPGGLATYTFDDDGKPAPFSSQGDAITLTPEGDESARTYLVTGHGWAGLDLNFNFERTTFEVRLSFDVGDTAFQVPKAGPHELVLDAADMWKKKRIQQGKEVDTWSAM